LARGDAQRGVDAEELAWSVWPARNRPLAAAVVLAGAAVLGALIRKGTGDGVLAVAGPAFVLASLGSFLFPSRYLLTSETLEVRTAGVARVRPWSEVRRMEVDAAGVFLSPFERPTWLEAYRGVRLAFGGNRDQVLAFVEARLRPRGVRAKTGSGAPGP
jgi:hypothetical protein